MCELVGAFIGDGYLSASSGKYTVLGFSGNGILDKDYFNHLVNLIKKNFPTTSYSLTVRKDENTIVLRNDSFMNAVIRGIFDTDGCLFFDSRKKYSRPYPRIVLQMASIPLIEQLETQLSKNFSLYVNKSNRDGKRNSLEIYGHLQLERFLKQVGFSNKRHLSKLPL